MSDKIAPVFRRQIALPQDHGSWVFILSPLLIGLFTGGQFRWASLYLIVAIIAVFLSRQPASIAVKATAGRRSRKDLYPALFWLALYGAISLIALSGLIVDGFGHVLFLAVPGAPVFAWHLYLVGRRAERRQAGVEILGTGVLALSAPAAYWVGQGRYEPIGWWLWLLVWLQSAASIVYAYLRLEQREISSEAVQARGRVGSGWSQLGQRAFLYVSFNLALSLALSLFKIVQHLIFIPYLLQWLETLWGLTHPAAGWKATRIGVRQLIVSALFTVSFIACWRLT
jgi:hypothetical protein